MTFSTVVRLSFRTLLLHAFLPFSILTAVISSPTTSRAAIGDTEIELDTKKGPGSQATPEEIDRARAVHASPAPPIRLQTTQDVEYFYRYRKAFAVRGGTSDARDPGPLFGFLYLFSNENLKSFEAGADLIRNGNGVLHVSIFNLSGRDRFRWFHKYGVGLRIVAEDRLATFLRLKHWTLRAGGGFEFSLQDRVALRADLEALGSVERLDAQGSLGLSFAW